MTVSFLGAGVKAFAALLLLSSSAFASPVSFDNTPNVLKRADQSILTCLIPTNNCTPHGDTDIPLNLQSIPLPQIGNATYDYVIVGAGTGGATLASRLSENPLIRVAVLEAGIDYTLDPISAALVSVPGYDVVGCGSSPIDAFNDRVDWGFETVPQAGANNRVVRYARGKTLGGTSTRNFMIYQRPAVGALQKWVQLTGNPQWSFANFFPYFQRSPSFTPPKRPPRDEIPAAQYNAAAFSPTGGPLSVSYPNTAQKFSKYVQLALNEAGVPTAQDFNSGKLDGVQYNSATINPNGGTRSTSRSSFLNVAALRPNLDVFSAALAKKIIFTNSTNGGKPRATGVVYSYLTGTDLTLNTLTATREVIVSAGAFHSPQLLMVSGIGPRDQLQKFNIPIVYENANVGQNMQDHVFAGPTYEVDPSLNTFTRAASDAVYTAAQTLNFTAFQLGPFTNNVADLIAFFRVELSRQIALGITKLNAYFNPDEPHIEMFSAPGYVGDFSSLLLENAPLGVGGKQYATILAAIVAPLSRGTVTLASADTAVLPVIDPRWLTDPVDQKVAVYAFKQARRYFNTDAMKQVRTTPDEFFPGASVQTDDQILNWYRQNLMTVWHASCTTSMSSSPSNGVLDSNLRVWGVNSLRVVDAASFPQLPGGHPQSTVYALAERAADLIRQANGHL